jgi:hypothetical protein
MQRGRAVVTLPYIDKLNERAHFVAPNAFGAGISDPSYNVK